MSKLFLIGIFFTVFWGQLPPKVYATLVTKTLKFNYNKISSIHIIYDKNKDLAEEIASNLNGKAIQYSLAKASSEENVAIIFIDLNTKRTEQIRLLHVSPLSFSYNPKQIGDVSVSYDLKPSGRPQILLNRERVKEEANFKAAFIKVCKLVSF